MKCCGFSHLSGIVDMTGFSKLDYFDLNFRELSVDQGSNSRREV